MLISWLRSETLRPFFTEDDGQPTGEPATPPTPPAETVGDDFDKPRALETIRKLREFEKTAKAQLKELETLKAEKQQRDEAELSAAEKAEKKAADIEAKYTAAQAQLKRATLKEAVQEAAAKKGLTFAQGALSDALALGIFDTLTWEGDTPKGITQALNDLAQARPYLFAAAIEAPDIGALEKGKPKSGIDRESLAKRWGIKVG